MFLRSSAFIHIVCTKSFAFYLSFDLDHVFKIICFQYTYGGSNFRFNFGPNFNMSLKRQKEIVAIPDCYVWLSFPAFNDYQMNIGEIKNK